MSMKLRAARLALRIRWVDQVEQERDEARASRDEARELRRIAEARANGHQNTAHRLDAQVAETERVLTSRGYPNPGGGENLALSVDNALDREASRAQTLVEQVRAWSERTRAMREAMADALGMDPHRHLDEHMLERLRVVIGDGRREAGTEAAAYRATLAEVLRLVEHLGHGTADGDVVRAVDAAIDRERCRAQDFIEQVAREIGAPPARRFGSYTWPTDVDELLRHVAKRRRDAEIGLRAIRDRDRAVQLLADMLGKFAPDAFVAARAELEDLQGVSPSDHDEALAALVRRVGDVPREAYDPAMGGDIEPPPGRDEPEQHWAEQAIERAREYLAALGYRSIVDGHGEDLASMLREIGVPRSTHDPELVERLAAMTPGDCDRHHYAVFAEGGSAGPCPWCEIERTRAVLAPDIDTTATLLDTLARASIDSNRTQAVAAELRWWSWGRIVRGPELLDRADTLVTAPAPWSLGGRDPYPPRHDVWAADRECAEAMQRSDVEVPF